MSIELINASAGSGKTHSLTVKVVELINKGVEPESLMITTFTNRAAAELRSRIRYELHKNNLPEQANRINDGFIGTVNSVCGYLLKEYALDAGLSPALEVIAEEESKSVFRKSVDRIINEFAPEIDLIASRMAFDGKVKGGKDWRNDVKTIVDLARSNRIGVEELEECAEHSWKSFKGYLNEPTNRDLDGELSAAIQSALTTFEQKKKSTAKKKELETCLYSQKNNQLLWSDWVRLSKLDPGETDLYNIIPINQIANQVLCHPDFHKDLEQFVAGIFKCAIEALKDYASYKQEHGFMDFIDQETQVLEMAIHNNSFRESITDRLKVVMVDEFQDTSPLQLALFLELNKLAGKSIWVGDPKQAIYGFRGTDPQLIKELVSQIDNQQVLDNSWRSKENLVKFTNAYFSEIFHETDKEKLCLKVPDERKEQAVGGDLEAWYLKANNHDQETEALAKGVCDLLKRNPEIKSSEIAILCRKNENCKIVAKSLERLGVRASVGQGYLIDTKEGGLALAALRYMNNKNDTVALTEIVKLLSDGDPDKEWISEIMLDPEAFKQKWHEDDILLELNKGRKWIKSWSPIEALEQAISRVGLPQKIKSWSNPSLAISNLDAMRKSCREYLNQCSFERRPASIDGFISYLRDTKQLQAKGSGEETVNILTYHSAKGLEWPWVILTDLDNEVKTDCFGVNVEAAESFDLLNPLSNRMIQYWPWPFGKNKFDLFEEKIKEQQFYQSRKVSATGEAQRLLYVGMTRAKNGLVMAIRKNDKKPKESSLKTSWLDAMKDSEGNPALSFENVKTGKTSVAEVPITILEYSVENKTLSENKTLDKQSNVTVETEEYVATGVATSQTYSIAKVSPSQITATENVAGSWKIIEDFGTRIKIKGNPEMAVLGDAVHSYMGIDPGSIESQDQLAWAQKILKNWEMDQVIEATELVNAGNNLSEFIKNNYPGYSIYPEWPMTLRNEKGQNLQGWIDMLLESDEGYVIIDHKDFPAGNVEESMKKHIPQMRAYQDAVEKATRKPVKEILLHLPISGLMLQFS